MNQPASHQHRCRCCMSVSSAFSAIHVIVTGIILTTFAGCMTAQNTRFPSLYAWYPPAENQAFERQDPFSDPDIGPPTDFAPRGYDRPRSEARRAAEQRMFQGQPVGPEYARPGVPQGGLNSGRAVY